MFLLLFIKSEHVYFLVEEPSYPKFLFRLLIIRTDKWAETALGTKWGDKWEEKFFEGIGSRQGETWHVTSNDERMSDTIEYIQLTDLSAFILFTCVLIIACGIRLSLILSE